TLGERRLNGDRRVHPGHKVGDRHAGFLRSAAGQVVTLAGDAHEPAHSLDDEIVPGAVRVRALLAEPGDRAVDQSWIDRGDARVIETVFCEPADLEIFDQDISLLRELADDTLPLGQREVDRDGELAAVAAKVIRGFAGVVPVRVLEVGRAPRTRVITAAGTLDLDHRRAEIREELRAPRTGEHARKIENDEMRQRAGHPLLGDAGLAQTGDEVLANLPLPGRIVGKLLRFET